jgi:hypothetical protein
MLGTPFHPHDPRGFLMLHALVPPPKGINLSAPMSKELIDNMKALSDKQAT